MPNLRIIVLLFFIGNLAFGLGWRAGYLPESAGMLALAGGGVAALPDFTLTTTNPAHVWATNNAHIEYSHVQLWSGLDGHSVRWQQMRRGRPMQIALRSLSDETLELRGESPTAEPLDYFGARYLAATVTHGLQLGAISAGLSATLAYERIYHYDAFGGWLSAGAAGNLGERIRWGAAVRQLGRAGRLASERESVGGRFSGGVGIALPEINGELLAEIDVDARYGFIPRIGGQFHWRNISIRSAYRMSAGSEAFSAGFHFRYHRWTVAYGIMVQGEDLGLPAILSISRRL